MPAQPIGQGKMLTVLLNKKYSSIPQIGGVLPPQNLNFQKVNTNADNMKFNFTKEKQIDLWDVHFYPCAWQSQGIFRKNLKIVCEYKIVNPNT